MTRVRGGQWSGLFRSMDRALDGSMPDVRPPGVPVTHRSERKRDRTSPAQHHRDRYRRKAARLLSIKGRRLGANRVSIAVAVWISCVSDERMMSMKPPRACLILALTLVVGS